MRKGNKVLVVSMVVASNIMMTGCTVEDLRTAVPIIQEVVETVDETDFNKVKESIKDTDLNEIRDKVIEDVENAPKVNKDKVMDMFNYNLSMNMSELDTIPNFLYNDSFESTVKKYIKDYSNGRYISCELYEVCNDDASNGVTLHFCLDNERLLSIFVDYDSNSIIKLYDTELTDDMIENWECV